MRPEVCALKILVTVKLVPDTNADKRIDPATMRLVRTGVETVLNPFDEYALEAALLSHRAQIEASGELAQRRRRHLRAEVIALASASWREELERRLVADGAFEGLLDEVVARRLDPASAARELSRDAGA